MDLDLSLIPFIQARWYIQTSGRVIAHIVVHAMQAPESEGRAANCANNFAVTERPASAHYCIDDNEIWGSVLLKDVCYGANGVNHDGIHLEHAGYSDQTSTDWLDEYGRKMLTRSAALTAELCREFRLPVVFVNAEGLLRGDKGITTHAEAEIAFPYGGHWDPGPEFPMDYYLSQVEDFLMDQRTFCTFYAQSRGGPEVSQTREDGHGGLIAQTRLRDRSAERQLEHDWYQAGNPPGSFDLSANLRYVWEDVAAGDQFTHLEASGA